MELEEESVYLLEIGSSGIGVSLIMLNTRYSYLIDVKIAEGRLNFYFSFLFLFFILLFHFQSIFYF